MNLIIKACHVKPSLSGKVGRDILLSDFRIIAGHIWAERAEIPTDKPAKTTLQFS